MQKKTFTMDFEWKLKAIVAEANESEHKYINWSM